MSFRPTGWPATVDPCDVKGPGKVVGEAHRTFGEIISTVLQT